MRHGFVDLIEHFAPHVFQALQGEGLYRSHSHDLDEITLILDGEGHYTSNEQNIRVAAGDLILIPPNLFHGFVCLKAWQGISMHFSSKEIPAYCQFLLQHAYQQYPNQILLIHLDQPHLDRAKSALQQMEEEWSRERVHEFSYDLMRNALETLLLSYHVNVSESAKHVKTEEGDDERIIQDVLKEIHRSYHTALKISDLAAHHFLSESMFRKKFTERIGISPKQYLISLRLNEAKRLLRHTLKPVEWIASEVGFTSSSRFHELFVKNTGTTPLEWRKKV